MALVHCRECGEMISESAPTCPKCGASQNCSTTQTDKTNLVVFCILSVLIPIVGLVLFLVKRKENPDAAKWYIICALIGFFVYLILL